MVKLLSDFCLQCISCNLHTISNVGKYLPTKLKEEVLRRVVNHDMLTKEYLPHITYHLFSPALRSIQFRWCAQITDEVLLQLVASKCKLERIVIEGCENVTDKGLGAFLAEQDQVQSLELKELQKITCQSLQGVFSSKLTEVDLFRCSLISTDGIISLVTKNPNISKLNLDQCYKVTQDAVPYIARNLGGNLQYLDLSGLHTVADDAMSALTQYCHHIKELSLCGCNRVTSQSLSQFFRVCKNLQSIELSFCYTILQPEGNSSLEEIPPLVTTLSVGGLQIESSKLMRMVSRLPKLQSLILHGIDTLKRDTLEEILKVTGPQLTYVDFGGNHMQFNDDMLAIVVKYCPNLEGLSLAFCTQIHGTPLLQLVNDKERAEKIENVKLTGCREVSYDVLHGIAINCKNIVELRLSGLKNVDNQILSTIANNCPHLKIISFKSCLTTGSQSSNKDQISDQGVLELARHCQLTEVVASGIHTLTDKSVLALANNCPNLECLYVSGCGKVTSTAINYLKDVCNGRVHVVHRNPNADPNLIMAKNLDTGEFMQMDLLQYQRL